MFSASSSSRKPGTGSGGGGVGSNRVCRSHQPPFSLPSPLRPPKALLMVLSQQQASSGAARLPGWYLFRGSSLLRKGRISKSPQGRHCCKSQLCLQRLPSLPYPIVPFPAILRGLRHGVQISPQFFSVFSGSIGLPFLTLVYHNVYLSHALCCRFLKGLCNSSYSLAYFLRRERGFGRSCLPLDCMLFD